MQYNVEDKIDHPKIWKLDEIVIISTTILMQSMESSV